MKKVLSVIIMILMIVSIIPIGMFSAVADTITYNITGPTDAGTSTIYDFDISNVDWTLFSDAEKVLSLSFSFSYQPIGGVGSFRIDPIDANGEVIAGNSAILSVGSRGSFNRPDTGAKIADNSKGTVSLNLSISFAQSTYGAISATCTGKITGSFPEGTVISGFANAKKLRFTFTKTESGAVFTNIKLTRPTIQCDHINTTFSEEKSTDTNEVWICDTCKVDLVSAHSYPTTPLYDENYEYYTCTNSGCGHTKTVEHKIKIDSNRTTQLVEYWACSNTNCTYEYTDSHSYPTDGVQKEDGLHFVCEKDGCGYDKLISDKLTFDSEKITYNDFDGNTKTTATGGFGFKDATSYYYSLEGNMVLKPNGEDGTNTTWVQNVRWKNTIPTFDEIIFDLRIDTPMISGTFTALFFDHYGADNLSSGSQTAEKRLKASYVSIGADENGTFICTGDNQTNKFYITLGKWMKIVIKMPEEQGGSCFGFVKEEGSDNYVYIGSHAKTDCLGSKTYEVVAFYWMPISGVDYYVDNYKIVENGYYSKTRAVGYQKSEVVNEQYSIRFVLGLDGMYPNEEYVGFDIECEELGKSWTGLNLNKVYKSISADYGMTTITAEDLDVSYLGSVVIENVPVSAGEFTLTVNTYTVIKGEKIYGIKGRVTIMP